MTNKIRFSIILWYDIFRGDFMIIEMGYLFNRNGATLPVELVEQIDDAKDYPDVVEFAEPVKIEGTLKNEDDVFVLDAMVKRQC